jgi:Ser/Thr protein kinase RdoA (MazF antagonist)
MTDFYALNHQAQAGRLEAAARDVLGHWNLQGAALHLIKYRENAVFRIEQNGERKALRLHRHGYHSDAELHSELQWMQALAKSGIAVPTVIPTDSGEMFVSYAADDLPGNIQVDLFEWIDGTQLGSVEEGITDAESVADTYSAIGDLAARVHNQAVTWALPSGFIRHAWNAEGLAGEKPVWGQFWELAAASTSETELLLRGRERVYEELRNLPKSPGSYSMIHADFVAENVLVNDGQVRLIDFDDAGFGWHLFELATSLYFIQGEPYFDEARRSLIKGYRGHRQLDDQQLELLPLFFLARGFTYIGWVHTRQETETAKELTPMLLATVCELAENYLSN